MTVLSQSRDQFAELAKYLAQEREHDPPGVA